MKKAADEIAELGCPAQGRGVVVPALVVGAALSGPAPPPWSSQRLLQRGGAAPGRRPPWRREAQGPRGRCAGPFLFPLPSACAYARANLRNIWCCILQRMPSARFSVCNACAEHHRCLHIGPLVVWVVRATLCVSWWSSAPCVRLPTHFHRHPCRSRRRRHAIQTETAFE